MKRVAAVVLLLAACKQSAAEEDAARAKEKAAQDRYNQIAEDQRRANEAAAARRAAMYPDVATIESPQRVERRDLLATLARDPQAIKPKEVTPPKRGEPEVWTTYEYFVSGLGEVVQWRTNERDWAIFLKGSSDPEIFAPSAGLRQIVKVNEANVWWRVTSGPFHTSFVQRSPGGIEVRSTDNVCDGGGLEAIRRECGFR